VDLDEVAGKTADRFAAIDVVGKSSASSRGSSTIGAS
jgi:hypothetical protein